MKLLHLVEASLAGVGRHVIDLTEGLLADGHEVHLLYSDVRWDKVFVDDLRRLCVCPGFRGLRVPMQRQPDVRDISAVRVLRNYLHRNGPFDLVHCHSTKAGLIGRLGLTGHSVKRLYTPHGFFTMDSSRSALSRRYAAALEVALSKLCHGVIVVSREEHAHALQLGLALGKIHLIRNGVARASAKSLPSRVALRREWGIGESDVCIGFVGRMVPVKSPETMIRSFAALLALSRAPAKLVMVGDGPLAGACRRLCVELLIEPLVVWLGERDARILMNAFDVLALTSESESAGLVVLEAMARGLPVVATCVGVVPEAVHSGVNGFVAPIGGVPEIAAALDTLANNLALREQMGHASRVLSQSFSVEHMVGQTIAFYEQVVSGAWNGNAAADWEVAAH